MVGVRLTDVAPDGTSALISFGILNLSHRDGHEHPAPMMPGTFYDIVITLKPIAQTVPKGHRLRVAVSSSYWPMAWPAPENATLTIDPGKSHLEIPVLRSTRGVLPASFEPPDCATPGSMTVKEPARERRLVHHDVESEITTFHIESDDGRYVLDEIGTEIASTRTKTYSIGRNDPGSARTTVACSQEYGRGDWRVRVESEVTVTSDRSHFQVEGKIRAYEQGSLFACRDFSERIPRDCM
jgi:hypothetical protein